MPDKLERIFELQRELNRRIGVDTDDMDEARQIEWVLNYSRALSQEVAELVDSVPWKWWAKYQKFDRQNAKVEVIDLLHFVVSLAQVLGVTAQEVAESYERKNRVNVTRQESGYDVKDEADNAAI